MKKRKFADGGRLEVRGKKPSLLERAAGVAEEYGYGAGIPGIVGSHARALGLARDLKQSKAQDDIIAKRKSSTPAQTSMAQRAKDRFSSVDPSEEPYQKGGSVASEHDPRKGRGRHGDTNYNPNYDLVPTQKERGAMQQEVEDAKLRKMDKRPNLGKMFKSGGYVKSADGCVKRGKTKGTMVKM